MGYFPNGSSNLDYMDEYCFHCRNWDDETNGCPAMDLHFRWNYDAMSNDTKRQALANFIPYETEDGTPGNGKCRMFLKREE